MPFFVILKRVNSLKHKKNILKSLTFILSGTLLSAFATAVFIIPFDLVVGGVSGISIILNKILNQIPTDTFISLLSISLFIIGIFTLGKKFALKTLCSAILYPIAVSVFSSLVQDEVLNGFFVIRNGRFGDISVILASLFSGILIGIGSALTFMGGGSTGGVDVIGFTVSKHIKSLKPSTVIFYVDATTIFIGMFVIKDLVVTLLGIISAFVWSVVVDKVFLGDSRALTAQIVTTNGTQIKRRIIEELERTATVIKATGGYSGKEKELLIVSFEANQYAALLNIVKTADETAFMTIHNAHEIRGEGWR